MELTGVGAGVAEAMMAKVLRRARMEVWVYISMGFVLCMCVYKKESVESGYLMSCFSMWYLGIVCFEGAGGGGLYHLYLDLAELPLSLAPRFCVGPGDWKRASLW